MVGLDRPFVYKSLLLREITLNARIGIRHNSKCIFLNLACSNAFPFTGSTLLLLKLFASCYVGKFCSLMTCYSVCEIMPLKLKAEVMSHS